MIHGMRYRFGMDRREICPNRAYRPVFDEPRLASSIYEFFPSSSILYPSRLKGISFTLTRNSQMIAGHSYTLGTMNIYVLGEGGQINY